MQAQRLDLIAFAAGVFALAANLAYAVITQVEWLGLDSGLYDWMGLPWEVLALAMAARAARGARGPWLLSLLVALGWQKILMAIQAILWIGAPGAFTGTTIPAPPAWEFVLHIGMPLGGGIALLAGVCLGPIAAPYGRGALFPLRDLGRWQGRCGRGSYNILCVAVLIPLIKNLVLPIPFYPYARLIWSAAPFSPASLMYWLDHGTELVGLTIALFAIVRRCHDLGVAGWVAGVPVALFGLQFYFPAITGLWIWVGATGALILSLAPGTPGPNRYGPDPLNRAPRPRPVLPGEEGAIDAGR
jgi:uncharacterized membrane protein YhaH (DUF805 family)